MDSQEFLKSLISFGGVPVILALVQLLKPFVSDTRYYPFMAVGFGLTINLVAAAWALGITTRLDWVSAAFMGILAGLAASGLYSAGSTMTEGKLADKSARGSLPPSPPVGPRAFGQGE